MNKWWDNHPTLHSSENAWSTSTYNNTDESHKHNAQQNKPEIKIHVLWFHYKKFQMSQNCSICDVRSQDNVHTWVGGE